MIKLIWEIPDDLTERLLAEHNVTTEQEAAERLAEWLTAVIPYGAVTVDCRPRPKYNVGDTVYVVHFAYRDYRAEGKRTDHYSITKTKISRVYAGKKHTTYYLAHVYNRGYRESNLFTTEREAQRYKTEIERRMNGTGDAQIDKAIPATAQGDNKAAKTSNLAVGQLHPFTGTLRRDAGRIA